MIDPHSLSWPGLKEISFSRIKSDHMYDENCPLIILLKSI
jgi:hypothetical protein